MFKKLDPLLHSELRLASTRYMMMRKADLVSAIRLQPERAARQTGPSRVHLGRKRL